MATRRQAFSIAVIVAALFVAAGLRNMYLPGFPTISPGPHGSGWGEIAAGAVIAALALLGRPDAGTASQVIFERRGVRRAR